ncbi:winged helix-turn-helix domain-containing protein [Pararhodospirillum photometricum]|uniref:winged helix-turn-helix domain-containing protein n=1 Tax=Pararhodospirillum photometricum TaxID=1084 RepID=UPI0002E7717D|nr:winged helix-turn-helix domain-containing protein [Pararhodospirillum photometricum]
MAAAVRLQEDFTAQDLRALARTSRCADQTRRLLALAEVYDGRSRTEAARVGGVGLQTLRDWVLAFNDQGPLQSLHPQRSPTPSLGREGGSRSSPPAIHGVVRWRLVDLAQGLCEEFRVSISKQTFSRELRAMGFRKLSARPRHHAQDAEASRHSKKLPRPPGQDRGP